ncbi:MAG: hypothetical protein AB1847_23315 [bacterium]
MRSLPAQLNTELLKEASFLVHLVDLYFSSTVYYTDLDVNVVWEGHTYLSWGLSFSTAEFLLAPQIDKISVEFDNVSGEMTSFVLNQEVRGKKCCIRLAALAAPASVLAASTKFAGVIDSCSIDHQRARFEVYNPWLFWKRKTPRRIHQATCPWAFKSTGLCQYEGSETWCDQSYDRCLELGNTENFGGFRFLPSLINKQIWWGRSPVRG